MRLPAARGRGFRVLYNCNRKRPKTLMTNTTYSLFPDLADLRGLSESEGHEQAQGAAIAPRSDEKRRSARGIAPSSQRTLPGLDPAPGVGGRHGFPDFPVVRGGYLDVCTVFEVDLGVKKTAKIAGADPRQAELASMGLPEYWLQVIEYLGVDTFLGMWRILDANRHIIPASSSSGANSMAPTLRTYSNYLRFQKNRFVETLAAQGVEPREIQKRVQSQLCETISIVHIRRLTQKAKIKR